MKVMLDNGLKNYNVEVYYVSESCKKKSEKELNTFLEKMNGLVEEYHHQLYLRDDFYNAVGLMAAVIEDEIKLPKEIKNLF